ncbi:SHOCT domain-containing protein [Mucisphaera sp.]|uniref:SHOCT domain-containing protein n=1 Tax=Mucisphaera sp. TaxID=2913024 RepID=UPI003D1281B8
MNSSDLIRAFVVLAGSFLLLGVVLAVLRVYLSRKPRSGPRGPAGGFTLRELRALHERGEISDEEFNAMYTGLTGIRLDGGLGAEPEGGAGAVDGGEEGDSNLPSPPDSQDRG